MNDLIVAITIISNVFLCLLLLYRGWSGRLQWFTLTTGLAVLLDALFYFIHGLAHSLYAPLRIFVVYWLFLILFALCSWEAHRVGVKWLEYLMLIQVGVAVVALVAHLHGDAYAVYRIEMGVVYLNLGGILLSIWKLRGAPRYEPSQA